MRRLVSMNYAGCNLKGSATVEMAYLAPTILLLIMMIIYTVFYFHDKNILIGAASETAVLGSQLERQEGEEKNADLNDFFGQRTVGKLILFASPQASIQRSEKQITVQVTATRGKMKITVLQKAEVQKPEKIIRQFTRLEQNKK